MEGSGTLEQQLEATRQKAAEVRARRVDLKKIEDLGQILEEHLILDNRYTEHRSGIFILCHFLFCMVDQGLMLVLIK